MKFQAEVDLVEVLMSSIQSTYNRTHIKIFQEVSVGHGIADIVVSDTKSFNACRNIEEILNYTDINILSLIERSKGLLLNDIINITRCQKQTIIKSIGKLFDLDYLIEQEEKYFINKSYELSFRNNFAIEAKLKDWKRALKQAYRYKWFAEYSFVVLDTYYTKSALKNIDHFVKYNVGLASISTDGTLSRHYNPTRQKPFDQKMQILFSEKVKSQTLER